MKDQPRFIIHSDGTIEQIIEPCEDCISRADVRRILNHEVQILNVNTWKALYEKIDDLPSVQPKPKADEPMQVELEADGYADGELVYDYGKCPKCGWEFEYDDKDWEQPYCCHCGQRLKWFESEDKE